jgi:conjugal transfer/type IV secretion protein DotA/TraY
MQNLIAASTTHLTDIMAFSATQDRTTAPSGYGDLTSMETPNDDGAGLFERVLRALSVNDKLLRLVVYLLSPTSATIVDPFGQLINIGQFMVTTSIIMLGAGMFFGSSTGTAALTAWSLLTGNVAGAVGSVAAHAVFSTFAVPIVMFIMALLIPGMMLAYLLPLTPAVIWLFGIINWLTRLAILTIAAPFWMFAHITLDDSGFTSRGITGWYEFVAVFFKPIFMIAGLILGFPLFAFGTWIATFMFYIMSGFLMGGGNLITNFFGMLADLSLFVLVMIAVATASFQLITIVPQKAQELLGSISANAFDSHALGEDIALKRTTGSLQHIQTSLINLTDSIANKQIAAGSGTKSNIAAASRP